MTDAQELEEIAGQQRYMDVSMWMKDVMGQLFQLAIALPQQTEFEELAVAATRRFTKWKLRCVCSVESKDDTPLKQVDAQRAVTVIAVEDAEKRYWRHPCKNQQGKPCAFYSGTKGNCSVHVTLETIE